MDYSTHYYLYPWEYAYFKAEGAIEDHGDVEHLMGRPIHIIKDLPVGSNTTERHNRRQRTN